MSLFTEKDLQKTAAEIAHKYWGLTLDIPVKINGRLSRRRGQYVCSTVGRRIEISKRLVQYESQELLISTLKHEVCHWALHTLGKPYKDGEEYFENELKRIGSHSSGTYSSPGERYEICCKLCGKVTSTTTSKATLSRKTNPRNGWLSKCCRAGLKKGNVMLINRAV